MRRRVTGYPTSSNRASSMHLRWEMPRKVGAIVGASVTLVVEAGPRVDDPYFWALQASFTDGTRARHGGAHLGLQWHPRHPGHTAANWGGYAPHGGELPGTESTLPSALGNPNTRDFTWRVGHPYRLRIEADPSGGWAGFVDDVHLRTLRAGGDRLDGLVVWSEVFARCDAPSVCVRWSDLTAVTALGGRLEPVAVVASYQTRADGGCDNTKALAGATGIRQITNTDRMTRPGERLRMDGVIG